MANLIDNAVRHNIPGGDIQVSTGTSGGHAVLSVTNSGPVIPPAEVDRLFQPFQRLGPRRARRDGGHGLGLSIVRAIATAHGAAIRARAQPGGGLAVDVTFPAPLGPRSQERHRQGHAEPDQGGRPRLTAVACQARWTEPAGSRVSVLVTRRATLRCHARPHRQGNPRAAREARADP